MISTSQAYDLFLSSAGIQTDTRKLRPKELYIALQGPHFDGNQFALKALEQGALAAIVSDPDVAAHPDCHYVLNTLTCLQRLAHQHRRTISYPIIGVTGSNGKTTTKELLSAVLGQKFRLHATHGNLNNHIGVPITLLTLGRDLDLAIVEMGANQPGDIKQLCQIADPTHGLITNIGLAHVEGFGSLEVTQHTKAALMHHVLYYQNKGFFFFNQDEPSLAALDCAHPQLIQIAQKNLGKGIRMQILRTSPTIQLQLEDNDRSVTISSSLYGSYNVSNLALSIAVGLHFDLTIGEIAAGIESYQLSDNRSQFKSLAGLSVYLDAYNANPTSVALVIDFFRSLAVRRKWLILGDMFELGDDEVDLHCQIVEKADHSAFDRVYLVGTLFDKTRDKRSVSGRIRYIAGTDNLIEEFAGMDWDGQTLYVKGSRGMRLERIMQVLPQELE